MTRTEYPPLLECCRGMWNHKKDCPQMTQRNEAAERLRRAMRLAGMQDFLSVLDEALAVERRATVEPGRIARAIRAASLDFDFYDEQQTDKAAAWISEYLLDEAGR